MNTFHYLIAIFLATAHTQAYERRVTNREFPDGSGSSKDVDPEKRTATEVFYDQARRPSHKIIYRLDERMHPVSGIYYNNAGRIFQKSVFKTEDNDRIERGKRIPDYRIIQEIVYDAKDRLICTKNFIYGTRNGQATLIATDVYDASGNLIKPQRGTQRRR